jgi:hypothetical protein
MTNGHAAQAGLIILGVMLIALCQVVLVSNMTQPQPQQNAPTAIDPSQDRYEQSPVMAIMWRTPNAGGMSPLGVLKSSATRMQYEQGTPLGNDQNAKALVKVLEAVAILEGRETVTDDGFPIIE